MARRGRSAKSSDKATARRATVHELRLLSRVSAIRSFGLAVTIGASFERARLCAPTSNVQRRRPTRCERKRSLLRPSAHQLSGSTMAMIVSQRDRNRIDHDDGDSGERRRVKGKQNEGSARDPVGQPMPNPAIDVARRPS
jgi:hypothetical protein